MGRETYVVAVRRDHRGSAPTDWVERLGAIEGVSIVGASSTGAQIRADDEGARRLRAALGEYLLVEPAIEHRPV